MLRAFLSFLALLLTSALLINCTAAPVGSTPNTASGDSTAKNTAVASAPKAAPEIVINASDFSLQKPDTIVAGWAKFVLHNDGQGPIAAPVARLNEGVTLDVLQSAGKEGPDKAMGMVTMAGGIGAGPGTTTEMWVNLKEGDYVIVGPEGKLSPFAVKPASANPIAPPKTDAAIALDDFSFELPATIKSGRSTFNVVNRGQQDHEIIVAQVAEGKTIDDLLAFFMAENPDGPPPGEMIGGLVGLNPGGEALLTMDLEPGTYYALCFIPDPGSHKSHVELGMIKEFMVH